MACKYCVQYYKCAGCRAPLCNVCVYEHTTTCDECERQYCRDCSKHPQMKTVGDQQLCKDCYSTCTKCGNRWKRGYLGRVCGACAFGNAKDLNPSPKKRQKVDGGDTATTATKIDVPEWNEYTTALFLCNQTMKTHNTHKVVHVVWSYPRVDKGQTADVFGVTETMEDAKKCLIDAFLEIVVPEYLEQLEDDALLDEDVEIQRLTSAGYLDKDKRGAVAKTLSWAGKLRFLKEVLGATFELNPCGDPVIHSRIANDIYGLSKVYVSSYAGDVNKNNRFKVREWRTHTKVSKRYNLFTVPNAETDVLLYIIGSVPQNSSALGAFTIYAVTRGWPQERHRGLTREAQKCLVDAFMERAGGAYMEKLSAKRDDRSAFNRLVDAGYVDKENWEFVDTMTWADKIRFLKEEMKASFQLNVYGDPVIRADTTDHVYVATPARLLRYSD